VSDCQENIFFIPSAFSPNYDNINDKLFIRGINIKSINFSIYDRYGREVFNTNNTNDVWDGAYNGKILGPDVFIYKADVIFLDKESKQFSGNISLIK
jgi:gliding motility-associated-like protein